MTVIEPNVVGLVMRREGASGLYSDDKQNKAKRERSKEKNQASFGGAGFSSSGALPRSPGLRPPSTRGPPLDSALEVPSALFGLALLVLCFYYIGPESSFGRVLFSKYLQTAE